MSGFVKFYTENCTLLASEQFHNERVVNLKCQSLRRAKYDRGFDNFPEEIHVIYPTNICLVNGVNLIQILRNYRSELARGKLTFLCKYVPLAGWTDTKQTGPCPFCAQKPARIPKTNRILYYNMCPPRAENWQNSVRGGHKSDIITVFETI